MNRLRRQQLKNGWILNIFQQGTPLIHGGDEFGNSQKGNNNAWCQDNQISWLDWNLLTKNQWLFEFVRELIVLRKKEKLLHPSEPFKMTDKNSNRVARCILPRKITMVLGGWKPDTVYGMYVCRKE